MRDAVAKVSIENLRKSFGTLEVLKSISLCLEEGSVTAVIGPSGSGKSTLLRCLNLLVTPESGTIRIGSHSFSFGAAAARPRTSDLVRFRAGVGMVFQHFNLFPHMTVLQNVMEGPRTVKRLPPGQCEAIAATLLDRVGLSTKARDYPNQLSGGQKQRVAIARALAMQPQVMLFDEATSALDPELVGEVLNVIRVLAKDGMTMIIVTHEIGFAREVADKVIFMRDGVIVEQGPAAQLIDRPQHEDTRAFLQGFHERSLPG